LIKLEIYHCGGRNVVCEKETSGSKRRLDPSDPEWLDEDHVYVNTDMTLAEASIPLARDGRLLLLAAKGNTSNLFVANLPPDEDDDEIHILFVGGYNQSTWESQLAALCGRFWWEEKRYGDPSPLSKEELWYYFPKYRYTGPVKPYEDLYIDAAQILGSENF
jgi:hypothetical protein